MSFLRSAWRLCLCWRSYYRSHTGTFWTSWCWTICRGGPICLHSLLVWTTEALKTVRTASTSQHIIYCPHTAVIDLWRLSLLLLSSRDLTCVLWPQWPRGRPLLHRQPLLQHPDPSSSSSSSFPSSPLWTRVTGWCHQQVTETPWQCLGFNH